MKTLFFLTISLFVNCNLFSQTTPQVIAVINQADWCKVCQGNKNKIQEIFNADSISNELIVLINDKTNDVTKNSSKDKLVEQGVYETMSTHKNTGSIYFINAETKITINQVSVAKPKADIKRAMDIALRIAKESN